MPTKFPKTRKCSTCGQYVQQRAGGALRVHAKSRTSNVKCSGSGK